MSDADPPLPGSLAALEGLDTPKGAYGAPRVARMSRALRVPLEALSPGEVRFLLAERRSPGRVIPLALERLASDPLLAADGTPGDLLLTLLAAADAAWEGTPPWAATLRTVLTLARGRLAVLPADLRQPLADELDVADARFGVPA
ncbi:MAG: hypothetical protein HY275_19350 [Gemmatimonadetes bacterium]|nr:hypothetical protein [Gemmatimonadota bacterium]